MQTGGPGDRSTHSVYFYDVDLKSNSNVKGAEIPESSATLELHCLELNIVKHFNNSKGTNVFLRRWWRPETELKRRENIGDTFIT